MVNPDFQIVFNTYQSLVSCDQNFFTSLDPEERRTCEKIAEYIATKRVGQGFVVEQPLDISVTDKKMENFPKDKIDKITQKITDYKQKIELEKKENKGSIPTDSRISSVSIAIYQKFHPEQVGKGGLFVSPFGKGGGVDKDGGIFPGEIIGLITNLVAGSIEDLPEASSDVIELLKKSSPTPEEMLQLIEWRSARDKVKFWQALAKAINVTTGPVIEECNTLGKMVEKAAEFSQWFKANKTALAELETLDLSVKQLAFLPPESGALVALKQLYLQGNQLVSLPPEIGKLAKLEWLDLSDNQLATLPPEFGALAALDTLFLPRNQLAALSPEIGKLSKLEWLNLSGNQLAALPPEIGKLAKLQHLFLEGNQLAALLPEIGKLAKLQLLDLGDNKLAALPPEIGALAELKTLDLKGNQLAALPPEIGALVKLDMLFLKGNQLAALPPQIGTLAKLRELTLEVNKLAALPPEIGALTALKKLALSGNQLATLPPEIGKLASLKHLYLEDNLLAAPLPPEIEAIINTLEQRGAQIVL